MADLGWVFGAIDPNGCQEIDMMENATQTYFNYVNGVSGYLVFAVGLTAIIVGIFGRNFMKSVPGWLTGVVIAGLAIGALPALLSAFGIDIGCGGNTVVENETPPPSENAGVAVSNEIVVVIDEATLSPR